MYIYLERQLSKLAEEIGLVYYDTEARAAIHAEGWTRNFPIFDADGNEVDEENRIDAAATPTPPPPERSSQLSTNTGMQDTHSRTP